jgi:hypothetical protein
MESENTTKNEVEEVLREVRKITHVRLLKNEGGGASLYYTMDEATPLGEYTHYATYPTLGQANDVLLKFTMLQEQDKWREYGKKKKGKK